MALKIYKHADSADILSLRMLFAVEPLLQVTADYSTIVLYNKSSLSPILNFDFDESSRPIFTILSFRLSQKPIIRGHGGADVSIYFLIQDQPIADTKTVSFFLFLFLFAASDSLRGDG